MRQTTIKYFIVWLLCSLCLVFKLSAQEDQIIKYGILLFGERNFPLFFVENDNLSIKTLEQLVEQTISEGVVDALILQNLSINALYKVHEASPIKETIYDIDGYKYEITVIPVKAEFTCNNDNVNCKVSKNCRIDTESHIKFKSDWGEFVLRTYLVDLELLEIEALLPQVDPIMDLSNREYRKEAINDFRARMAKRFQLPHNKSWYIFGQGGVGLTTKFQSPISFFGLENIKETKNNDPQNVFIGSKGENFNIGLGVGKLLSPFLGIELYLNYSHSVKTTLGSIISDTRSQIQLGSADEVGLIPELIFITPSMGNFTFYGKIGAYIPVYGSSTIWGNVEKAKGSDIFGSLDDPSNVVLIELKAALNLLGVNDEEITDEVIDFIYQSDIQYSFTTKVNFVSFDYRKLGFTAALGLKYQFNNTVGLFGEMRYTFSNLILDSSKNQRFSGSVDIPLADRTIEGLDLNTFISPGMLNTNYVREITSESNNPINYTSDPDLNGWNSSKPGEQLEVKESSLFLNFNIGFQINIPNKRLSR